MASEAAKAVAHEVISEVGKGRIPNKGKIIRKHGYAPSVAHFPQKVTETKSYKEVEQPFVKKLIAHRDKIIAAMEAKDLSKEQYKVLNDGLAKINHDLQLLSGGSTEAIKMSWE